MFKIFLVTSCVVFGLVAWAMPLAHAESVDSLYAKAKAEERLVLYAGGTPATAALAMGKLFEKTFPAITVTVVGGASNTLTPLIDRQLESKNLEADLAVIQTVQDLMRWNKQGELLKFKPEGFAMIPDNRKEKDGAFVGIGMSVVSYAYNTEKVRPGDVPQSALDFLKPQFHGKIIATYPQDDEATMYVFYTIVRKYGWSYMEKFMKNEPNFIQGHVNVSSSIAEGENYVTFDSSVGMTLAKRKTGSPADIAFSTVDATPVITPAAGIFKNARHPNAAKLYVTWLLSPEMQARSGVWPVRSDLPVPNGLGPLKSLKLADNYWQFLKNKKLIDDLRVRFAGFVGPEKPLPTQ